MYDNTGYTNLNKRGIQDKRRVSKETVGVVSQGLGHDEWVMTFFILV